MVNKYNFVVAIISSLSLYLATMRPVFNDLKFVYFLIFVLFLNTLVIIYLLRFKFREMKSNWDYFILPIFHIIGVFFFISFFLNPLIKLIIIFGFGISMYVIHQSLLACYKKDNVLSIEGRNILTSLSMITIFFCSVLIFNLYFYWETDPLILALMHFVLIFGINHFLFKQMLSASNLYFNLYNFIISLVVAEAAFVLNYWSVNYPGYNIDRAFSYLGISVGSLIILFIYYCVWGLTYYLIEGRLTKKVMNEYLLVSIIGFIFIVLTTKWIPIF